MRFKLSKTTNVGWADSSLPWWCSAVIGNLTRNLWTNNNGTRHSTEVENV